MSARKTIQDELEMPAAGAGDVDAATEEAGTTAGNTSTPKRNAAGNGSRPGAGQSDEIPATILQESCQGLMGQG